MWRRCVRRKPKTKSKQSQNIGRKASPAFAAKGPHNPKQSQNKVKTLGLVWHQMGFSGLAARGARSGIWSTRVGFGTTLKRKAIKIIIFSYRSYHPNSHTLPIVSETLGYVRPDLASGRSNPASGSKTNPRSFKTFSYRSYF